LASLNSGDPSGLSLSFKIKNTQIKNTGTLDLSKIELSTTDDATKRFAIDGQSCQTATLKPTEECTFTVTYDPPSFLRRLVTPASTQNATATLLVKAKATPSAAIADQSATQPKADPGKPTQTISSTAAAAKKVDQKSTQDKKTPEPNPAPLTDQNPTQLKAHPGESAKVSAPDKKKGSQASSGTPETPNQEITLTASLSGNPTALTVKTNTKDDKSTLAQNTVITSSAGWKRSAITFSSTPGDGKSKDSFYDRLNRLIPAFPKLGSNQAQVASSCATFPLYVVSNSHPPATKPSDKDKAGTDDKPKPGQPQYLDETARSVEEVLTISDACAASLTNLDGNLQAEIARRKDLSSQALSDLTALSTALTAAQSSGAQLVERDLRARRDAKKAELEKTEFDVKLLTQGEADVAALLSQVSQTRTSVVNQVTAAPATPDASKTSTVTDVFQTIEQNLLKFLLFSLIMGQILDPIQRGLVSFVGPRRDVFEIFNEVYGQMGDGEFRFGDRRVPPWTDRDTYLPRIERLKKGERILTESVKANYALNQALRADDLYTAGDPSPETVKAVRDVAQAWVGKEATDQEIEDFRDLRISSADVVYTSNMNIYDQNYAIGAGYISQSEFNNIYNDFYTQSQLTSGLILPLLILSVCIGIRVVCCATAAVTGAGSWWLIVSIVGAMYIGALGGLMLQAVVSNFGSIKYRRVATVFFWNVRGELDAHQDRLQRHFVGWMIGVGVILLLIMLANINVLNPEFLPLIMGPCLFLWSLWIAGLDRLHKYYSELQARIAGNILRRFLPWL
jgi:hypothetical protein